MELREQELTEKGRSSNISIITVVVTCLGIGHRVSKKFGSESSEMNDTRV